MGKISYKIETRPADPSSFCAVARDGKKNIGNVCAARNAEGTGFYVFGSEVEPAYQRRGIATHMYERAAREACKRGLPLHSDALRSEEIEPFWQKQLRKGRAKRKKRTRKFGKHVVKSDYYSLSCPAPRSLKGRR